VTVGLVLDKVALAYGSGDSHQVVLDPLSLSLPPGAAVGIGGPSGSGKSSLLLMLAGIQPPTSGRIAWHGVELAGLAEAARDGWRRRHVGLVFQDFHLIPGLSALANVLLPAGFAHWRTPADLRDRAAALLDRMGLKRPAQRTSVLSRGEQQRVALARALLFEPQVLLADEPTASLDRAGAETVGDLLVEAAAETGATLIVASHDRTLLQRLDRRYLLADGRLEPA
jgi:putative ABC transport system ATP-binding protein